MIFVQLQVFFAKSEYFKQLNFVWNTDDNENLLALGKFFSSNHWKLSMFSASEITFQSVLFLFFFLGEKKQMHDFYKERGLEVPKPGEL